MKVGSLPAALIVIVRATALVLLGCSSQAQGVPPPIPASLQGYLDSTFTGWRVLQSSDLDGEVQDFWREAHPNEHPGLIAGSFTGARKNEWVANLIRTTGGQAWQRLALVRQGDNGVWSSLVVLEPQKVGSFTVLLKNPPGTYQSFDRQTTVRVETDAFSLAVIWGGVRLFYWVEGGFKSFNISG
jgi:hypothetical protein